MTCFSLDWERLEEAAKVSFTEELRERIKIGICAAFKPKPRGSEHFEQIAKLAAELEELLSQDAEWPIGYLDDPKYSPIEPLSRLRDVAQQQAIIMNTRNPKKPGRPSEQQRDQAIERHFIVAWRKAGGTGNGFYSGADTRKPGGPLLEFIVELTKQAGHPMTHEAVHNVLKKRG